MLTQPSKSDPLVDFLWHPGVITRTFGKELDQIFWLVRHISCNTPPTAPRDLDRSSGQWHTCFTQVIHSDDNYLHVSVGTTWLWYFSQWQRRYPGSSNPDLSTFLAAFRAWLLVPYLQKIKTRNNIVLCMAHSGDVVISVYRHTMSQSST